VHTTTNLPRWREKIRAEQFGSGRQGKRPVVGRRRRRRRRRRCVREWRRDAGRRRGSRTRRAFRVARRKQWRRRGSPIQRGTEHRPRQAPPPFGTSSNSDRGEATKPLQGAARSCAMPRRAAQLWFIPTVDGWRARRATATPSPTWLHPDTHYAALVLAEKPRQGQRCPEARQLPGRLGSRRTKE